MKHEHEKKLVTRMGIGVVVALIWEGLSIWSVLRGNLTGGLLFGTGAVLWTGGVAVTSGLRCGVDKSFQPAVDCLDEAEDALDRAVARETKAKKLLEEAERLTWRKQVEALRGTCTNCGGSEVFRAGDHEICRSCGAVREAEHDDPM